MRYKTIISICMILVLLLGGCSQRTQSLLEGYTEEVEDTSISMEYTRFDGTRDYKIVLEKESEMRVNIQTTSGRLIVQIQGAKKENVYEGQFMANYAESKVLPAGKYRIYLSAESHAGKYTFDWS